MSTSLSSLTEHATLHVGGNELRVRSLDGKESVSNLFRFDIVVESDVDGPVPEVLRGEVAVITLDDGYGAKRTVHGVIEESRREIFDDEHATLELTVVPEVALLTLGRDSRVFNDMTVRDIVERVLTRSKAPHRWELTSTYRVRIHTVQYREDDWSFISRLLEEEGIYYWFEHEGGASTLVLADDSTVAPDLPGGAFIPFVIDTGMVGRKEQIELMGKTVRATSTKFTVSSFDPQRPSFKVMGAMGDGRHEHYDAPGGGHEDPAVALKRARVRLEAANAQRSGVSGHADSVRLVPGMVVAVGGHPKWDGRYLVTSSTIRVRQRQSFTGTNERQLVAEFTGVPQATAYRAPEDTPWSQQAGLQTGAVTGASGEEIFPDETGRVRVQLHWDREGARDEKAGKWMRVAQRGTASSMLLPRVGWNVLTFMEEGNVDAPTVLNRVADAEHPPPYSLPENKTRTTFKTATSPGGGSFNEIRYEDKAGVEEMFINASKDMNIHVQNIKTSNVSNNQTRTVGNNHDLQVGATMEEMIQGNQTFSVGANEEMTIDEDRKKTVKGNEDASIGGNRELTIGGTTGLDVTNDRTLEVGGSMLEKAMSGIFLRGDKTEVNIGAALLRLTQASVVEDTNTAALQMIGGARLEFAKGSRQMKVTNQYVEAVGGCVYMKTNGQFVDGSDEKQNWFVGAKINGKAPEVVVEAKDKIELVCGASVVTLLPDQIEIKAASYDLSGAELVKSLTKTVTHN